MVTTRPQELAGRMIWISRLVAIALAALVSACAATGPAPEPRATAEGPHVMVAAANPMAVDAGLKVLRRGGSAIDAAVAVQAVLGLVEPQSSGLGGGAFLTYYDSATHGVTAYDGRETAPSSARPDQFMGLDGKPLPFFEAVLGGQSTGVPGAIAMLALAQHQHGKLAWKDLFGDAERMAEAGFPVPPRLAAAAVSRAPQAAAPDAVAYLTRPDGARVQTGDVLKNPAYAATLREIATLGRQGLLEGPVAAAIVARVNQPPRPSGLTLADLSAYRAKAGPALCRPYRIYVVCVPRAPSGGPALLEGLGLLERTDIAKRGPEDPEAWRLFAEASRLMYADRDRYIGDPAFVAVPVEGLLDPKYLDARAALIGPVSGPAPAPGNPPGAARRAADATREPGGTSHFVVVDAAGNVVSMTTTVESVFGSGRMVAGFFLNNQLTDFSFSPIDPDGVPAANAVAPGKRPRSSMAPVVVLDGEGGFVAALGSPGGPAILAYNLKTLVGVLDWGLTLQAAIDLPNLIARGDVYGAELDRMPAAVADGLKARGVTLTGGRGEGSGLHGVRATAAGLEGGADPRRDGVAKGY
jgi:gamma-glutamyltranspeptidase/glutathione hydrolase